MQSLRTCFWEFFLFKAGEKHYNFSMRKLRQRAAKGKTRFRAWPYVVAGAIFVTIGSGVGVFNMLTRDGEEPEETKVRPLTESEAPTQSRSGEEEQRESSDEAKEENLLEDSVDADQQDTPTGKEEPQQQEDTPQRKTDENPHSSPGDTLPDNLTDDTASKDGDVSMTLPEPVKEDSPVEPRSEDESPQGEDATDSQPSPSEKPKTNSVEGYEGDLVLYGGGSTTPAQQALWRSWLERMIKYGEMSKLVPMLENRIREIAPQLIAGERLSYQSYKNSHILMNAVELCLLAKLVGVEKLDKFVTIERKLGEASAESADRFMRWLLLDRSRPLHRLLQAFVYHSADPSTLSRTVKVFFSIWKRAPERDRVRYMNLAIACSLVREEVAHSRGMLRAPDEKLLSIPELYDFFREQDIANTLLTDIRKLSITELLHVVDVRLPMSEFQWVKKKLDYQRVNWGDTYSKVKYLMERVTQDVDPYIKYTFEEILEEGGVCRDQAYFCATSAKTRGLPAVIITGDGDRGPHAWVALYTSEKGGWTTSGSYGYKTGRYMDPCSGLSLHESMLLARDKRLTPDRLEPAMNCMVLSDYLCRIGCKTQAMGTARYVTIAFPQLTVSWRNLVDVMELCGKEAVSMTAWRRLYVELTHQSKKNKELMDLMQAVQNDHVMEGRRDNVKMNALKKSSRKMDELIKIGRIDLAMESLERQAAIYVRQEDYRGLAGFFKSYLKEYVGQPDVFGKTLELYMRMLDDSAKNILSKTDMEDKQREEAVRAIWRTCAKDADGLYTKTAFSGGDFFAIKKEAGIMRCIAECWRLAGEEKKAERLESMAGENYEKSRERNTSKRR